MITIYILGIIISVALIAFFIIAILACFKYVNRPLIRIYRSLQQQADYCPLDDIPHRFVDILINSEDAGFYQHNGISKNAIKEALQINFEENRIISGGSTITQQLIKNLYFNFDKSICRKLQEALLTIKAEHVLSKDELLEMYINIIYYGCGQYGLASASNYYFSKLPKDLTLNQMFMLVRILNAPTANNPITRKEAYLKSRNRRVNSWERYGLLTTKEAELIRSYDVNNLDPDLRECTNEAELFVIAPMKNERYGCDSKFGK